MVTAVPASATTCMGDGELRSANNWRSVAMCAKPRWRVWRSRRNCTGTSVRVSSESCSGWAFFMDITLTKGCCTDTDSCRHVSLTGTFPISGKSRSFP